MAKAVVLLVVLALSGSSTGVIQCVLACAPSGGATTEVSHRHGDTTEASHRHGERSDGARIGTTGHTCSHQDTTTVAVLSSSGNSQTVPTFLTIAPFVSNPALAPVHGATVSTSPPGSSTLGSPTRPLPLRI